VQEFEIVTTQYSPTDKRKKTSSIKVKAVFQRLGFTDVWHAA
jgi:hypothetical protein